MQKQYESTMMRKVLDGAVSELTNLNNINKYSLTIMVLILSALLLNTNNGLSFYMGLTFLTVPTIVSACWSKWRLCQNAPFTGYALTAAYCIKLLVAAGILQLAMRYSNIQWSLFILGSMASLVLLFIVGAYMEAKQ